jgi:hypothetical protein
MRPARRWRGSNRSSRRGQPTKWHARYVRRLSVVAGWRPARVDRLSRPRAMRAASKARTADTAAAHGAQSRDSPDFFGNMVDTIGRVGTHLMRSSDRCALER